MKHKCQNPSCHMGSVLYLTSFSAKQGCTHYCKVCGWGYWTHTVKPESKKVDEVLKANPKFTRNQIIEYLTEEVLKPFPEGEWGKTAERKMIEHLGGFQPYWLRDSLKRYWKARYLELHPETEKK